MQQDRIIASVHAPRVGAPMRLRELHEADELSVVGEHWHERLSFNGHCVLDDSCKHPNLIEAIAFYSELLFGMLEVMKGKMFDGQETIINLTVRVHEQAKLVADDQQSPIFEIELDEWRGLRPASPVTIKSLPSLLPFSPKLNGLLPLSPLGVKPGAWLRGRRHL